MEIFDACSAMVSFRKKFPGSPAVLWGFSLGGLISVLIAGGKGTELVARAGLTPPESVETAGIIVSGSGDELRPEAGSGLRLPVLDTLCDKVELFSSASRVRLEFALFFYGDLDESFSEASSRRIFDRLPLEGGRKEFHIIKGADHSFRRKNGLPSKAPLEEMIIKTRAALERY